MVEYKEERPLPKDIIPFQNILINQINRVAHARSFQLAAYPDCVEALFMLVEPEEYRKEIEEWRKNEEHEVDAEARKLFNERSEQIKYKYDKLFRFILKVLDDKGMLFRHDYRMYGRA